MKVLHVITGLSTGGTEMLLARLLSRLQRFPNEHIVVCLSGEGNVAKQIRALGASVECLGWRSWLPNPANIGRLHALLRRYRADCIQGWMYHGNLAALLGTRPVIWGIRQSLHWMSGEKASTALVIRLGALVSGMAHYIVYNSAVSAEQHEAIGYRRSRRVLIPNGFDAERFKPSDDARRRVRHLLKVGEDAFLVGMVGRYHPVKNHALFVEAARHLLRSHPDAHFVLIGTGVDAVANFVRSDGLAGRFHLLGEQADIEQWTAALDIATCCSHAEAFPNVVGEAMACAVPCVVTAVGEAPAIVADTGRVVPADAAALANAWADLLDMRPLARRDLGSKARARVVSNYSLDTVAESYRVLYERAVHGVPVPCAAS